MRSRYILAVAVAALAATSTPATEGTGGQAGALYRYGCGAHVLGLGSAVMTLSHGPVSVLANPSGAAAAGRGSWVASHTRLPMDRSINVLGFARQMDERAGFAVTWVNAGVDGLVRYDADGANTGTLDNSENAVAFTFGTRYKMMLAGVSAKWYRIELDDRSAANWMLSVGVTVNPMPDLRIAGVIRDVGGDLRWNSEAQAGQVQIDDPFPSTSGLGVSYAFRPVSVTAAVNYEKTDRDGEYVHYGVSWAVMQQLRVRAGYRWFAITDGSHEPAITGGATIHTRFGDGTIGFDYAAVQDVFGLVHSIGVRYEL